MSVGLVVRLSIESVRELLLVGEWEVVDLEDSRFAYHFHFVAVLTTVVEFVEVIAVSFVVAAAACSEVLEQSVLVKTSSSSSAQPNVEPLPSFDYFLVVLGQ